MNDLKRNLLIGIPVSLVLLGIGIFSIPHVMFYTVAGAVLLFIGVFIPAITRKPFLKALYIAMAFFLVLGVALFAIFGVIIVPDSVNSNPPNYPQQGTVIATLMPANSTYGYSPNGTILAANAQSSHLYGLVRGGIEFNITNSIELVGSWKSTSAVSAIVVPLKYIHNMSVIGKVLSIAKPSVSGSFAMQFGMATNTTWIVWVLMFFPAPGQNGTVTFTTALVIEQT